MFEDHHHTQRSATNCSHAGHRRLPQLMLALALLLASSIVAGTSTAAQDERLDISCAPERLEASAASRFYSCEDGPQGNTVVKWKKEYEQDNGWSIPTIVLGGDILFAMYFDSLQALDAGTAN